MYKIFQQTNVHSNLNLNLYLFKNIQDIHICEDTIYSNN